MNNTNIEKILLWTVRVGLGLTLYTFFFISQNYFFPFITGRTMYFQIVTELTFIAAVALAVFYPQYRPKLTNIFKIALIFFAVGALATITSVYPSKSFLGTVERGFGFFNIAHFLLLFFIALVALRNKKEWLIFLGITVAVSAYISLDFITTKLRLPDSLDAQNTITGNRTFISAYLIIQTMFALYLSIQSRPPALKYLFGATAVMQIVGILMLGVRGAFIGIAAAAAYLLGYIFWKRKDLRIVISLIVTVLIASYALLYINRESPFVRNNAILSRVTAFTVDSTVKSRFAMWRMVLKGFPEHPILGWGRENFATVFNKHFDKSFNDAKLGEGWEDRAHNVFFDELVYGGIVELLAYIALLAIVFWNIRREPVLAALLAGYTAQNFTGVDTINSYIPFFIFLAYASFLESAGLESINKEMRAAPISIFNKYPDLRIALTAGTAVIILALGYWFTIIPPQANNVSTKAYVYMMQNDYTGFSREYEKAKKLIAHMPAMHNETIYNLSRVFGENEVTFPRPNNRHSVLFASTIIKDLKEIFKKNDVSEQRGMLILGQLLMLKGLFADDMSSIEEAINVYKTLLEASPDRAMFAYSVTQATNLKSNIEEAIRANKNTPVKQAPNPQLPQGPRR